jgi:hypothetical protein
MENEKHQLPKMENDISTRSFRDDEVSVLAALMPPSPQVCTGPFANLDSLSVRQVHVAQLRGATAHVHTNVPVTIFLRRVPMRVPVRVCVCLFVCTRALTNVFRVP